MMAHERSTRSNMHSKNMAAIRAHSSMFYEEAGEVNLQIWLIASCGYREWTLLHKAKLIRLLPENIEMCVYIAAVNFECTLCFSNRLLWRHNESLCIIRCNRYHRR